MRGEYMRVARAISRLSPLEPKVGAILVYKGEVVATGYNREVDGTVWHAEREAIVQGAAHLDYQVAVMYVTTQPCINCANLIIAAGIKRLYFQNPWWDKATLKLFKDAGVIVERIRRASEVKA